MSFIIKDFNGLTDKKYLSGIQALADEGLSPGFVTEEDLQKIGSGEYFCSFALDENDKVCSISFGRFLNREELVQLLRCSNTEIDFLFPDTSIFAEHLGIVVRPDVRGLGLAKEMHARYETTVFHKTRIIFYGVWNRHGGEKACVTQLLHSGAVFFKTVPHFWYDYPEMYCALCKGRCTCDCDFYYINWKG